MSSRSKARCDVFICFCAKDTRNKFVSHLAAALHRKRIKTFPESDDDDDDLEAGGHLISSSELQAIKESMVAVIVFSENFVASRGCLIKLEKTVECCKTQGLFVVPVFYEVPPFEVRNYSRYFEESFVKHKHHVDEVTLHKWKHALKEVVNLPGWPSSLVRPDSALVDQIVQDIEKKLRYPKHSIEVAFVVTNFIMEILSAVSDQLSSPHKPFFALLGMLMSILSLLFCIAELAYKGRAQGVHLRCIWPVPWFYHPPPGSRRLGSVVDIIGLFCAAGQLIVTAINYSFAHRHDDSPVKIAVWPPIFAFGLLCSKFMEKPTRKRVR